MALSPTKKQRAGLWGFQRLVPLMIEMTKAAPHGEAFTININLKNFIHEKIIYLFLSQYSVKKLDRWLSGFIRYAK